MNIKKTFSFFISVIITGAYLLSASASANTLARFEQQLNQYKGKVVYLDFWASWCVPCRRSFPWMNEIQTQYRDKGLVVLSVNLDADQTFATQFLNEVPANFAIFYDPKGAVAKAFKLRGMPSSYLIDRSGKRVSAHVGFNEKKKALYQAELEQLLAQQ